MSNREAAMKLEDKLAQAKILRYNCGCKIVTMPGSKPVGFKCDDHKNKTVVIKLPKK